MKKITKEEFNSAQKTIELYTEQLKKERTQRVPKFGDCVRCLCSAPGRYIGKGQAVYISSMCNEISRDLIDMEADWENINNLPLVSDSELIEFIKKSKWID